MAALIQRLAIMRRQTTDDAAGRVSMHPRFTETRLRLMLPRIFLKRRRIGRVDLAVVAMTNLYFGLMVQ